MKNKSLSENLYINIKSQFYEKFPLEKNRKVLVAVSGGADSMVLLHLLKRLSVEIGFQLIGITVNHNIRKKEESLSDVMLVKKFAEKIEIPLCVKEFERGFLEKMAKTRGKGIEEAARFYRYSAINDCAAKLGATCICFAHNKNDQLETLIQQFLQGNIINGGIPAKRDIIFRPLLENTREEIEQYAIENNIEYCVDSTNLENKYFRNKIRNQLVPVLNSLFPTWEKGILACNQKIQETNDFVKNDIKNYSWEYEENSVYFDFLIFSNLEKILKINLLYKGINTLLKYEKEKSQIDFQRFPYDLLNSFSINYKKVNSGNFEISTDNKNIKIKIIKKEYDNNDFYYIIDKIGFFNFPFGEVEIIEKSHGIYYAKYHNWISGDFLLPVVIRSRDENDLIQDKNNNRKNISKIFSEWKVPENLTKIIPIFCDEKNRGIWGEPFGFENYFVKINEEL